MSQTGLKGLSIHAHTFLHRDVYKNALSNIIRNSLKQEVIQMSIVWWMGRLMVVRFSSVQFSRSVVSDSSQPHESQHARPPCPSPIPGACSNSCPSSRWCHPTISSSVVPFSSCLQSSPASGSFPMSQFFTSGDQSTGASTLVLPMNIQRWFPLELTGFIFLQSKGLLRVFCSITVWKHQRSSAFFIVQLSHPYMTTEKTIALTIWTFVGKVMSLLFDTTV